MPSLRDLLESLLRGNALDSDSDSHKQGDVELIIKKKQYKPPKEEKSEDGSMAITRPRKVSPMSQ